MKGPIGSPVLLEVGPVLALDDAVGMKVAALHDRAAHRDFIDVHAAASGAGWEKQQLRWDLDAVADDAVVSRRRDERQNQLDSVHVITAGW